jgi:tRNA pseudouridine13 synthase
VSGRCPDSWTRASLNPPRAHGAPLPAVEWRAQPEDFCVDELLSFEPAGVGPHWLLRVEKRGANTRWVAAELARLASTHPGEVGYAGLKDRHALTVQWFSVPAQGTGIDFWSSVSTQEFRVLDVRANMRKLKRGALTGNRFTIRLRKVGWSREQLEMKLAALRLHGVPNYFGPQRFGREAFNLDRLAEWIQSGASPRGRTPREFALSAARALLFNAALSVRVEAQDWSQLLPGDLANLDGSGSHFAVENVDDELRERLARFDIHPSGPLWGRGGPATHGRPLEHELSVGRAFPEVAELLAREGLQQERRALRSAVHSLSAEYEASGLKLEFQLGRGQFATAVLREICAIESMPVLESGED